MKEFTTLEVKEVVFQMTLLSSPGPDGFSTHFYQKKGTVGKDVTNFVITVIHHGASLAAVNDTFIIMIPKIKNPCNLFDYHPNSLCNGIYKIVVKVVANRLKCILPDLSPKTKVLLSHIDSFLIISLLFKRLCIQ